MPRLPKSSSTRGRAKGVGSQSKSAQPALEAVKILQRRIENGRVEYQVKWKNHPFGLPTWEPADSVKNLNLIADFEASRKRLILGKLPRVSYRRRNKRYFQEEKNGFQRGLKAERIISVTDITGQLEYLIKFEGCETPEFIPKQIANVQCPLLVLEYYESLLRWDIMVNKDEIFSELKMAWPSYHEKTRSTLNDLTAKARLKATKIQARARKTHSQ